MTLTRFRLTVPALIFGLAAIMAAVVLVPTALRASQQSELRGVFGLVTSVSVPLGGNARTKIVLETGKGENGSRQVEIFAGEGVKVRIPGMGSASVASLRAGDPVAVLASGDEAVSILVKSRQPVNHRHFTGIVVSVDLAQSVVVLQDRNGQQISTPAIVGLSGLQPAELVTAVLEQDLATGGLVVTGLDRASSSLQRAQAAIRSAQGSNDSPGLSVARQRLISNSARHLSTLQDLAASDPASQGLSRSLRTRLSQELESRLATYSAALAQAGAGEPRAEISGIIAAMDGGRQRITLEARGLGPVEISITSDTDLWRAPAGLPGPVAESWLIGAPDTADYVNRYGGRQGRFQQLDLANRVKVWYGLETAIATRVLVLPGDSLDRSKAEVLLSLARRGEAAGRVVAVNEQGTPPSVTFRDDITQRNLQLFISTDSVVMREGDPVPLASIFGASATASFDPQSLEIAQLNAHEAGSGQEQAFGVVHSFVPKVLPGNFSILEDTGRVRSFNHTGDTVIIRDGRRATIGQVRIGDLVRPSTQYQGGGEGERELRVLSLKSPQSAPLRGVIRGITPGPAGGANLTISNSWLELVTVAVDGQTKLKLKGNPIGVGELAVGQRVLTGAWDPISSAAERLNLAPPRSLRIMGEITSIDLEGTAVTITPGQGPSAQVFDRDSTPVRLSLTGVRDPEFADLQVGQQVLLGFYDPESREALSLVVK